MSSWGKRDFTRGPARPRGKAAGMRTERVLPHFSFKPLPSAAPCRTEKDMTREEIDAVAARWNLAVPRKFGK